MIIFIYPFNWSYLIFKNLYESFTSTWNFHLINLNVLVINMNFLVNNLKLKNQLKLSINLLLNFMPSGLRYGQININIENWEQKIGIFLPKNSKSCKNSIIAQSRTLKIISQYSHLILSTFLMLLGTFNVDGFLKVWDIS